MKKNYLSRRKFNTQILIGTLGLTTTQTLLAQNNFKLKVVDISGIFSENKEDE